MKIFNAISKVFESTANVVTNVADVAVMGTDLAKEAVTDEGIKRDLSSAKEIIDLRKELNLNQDELAEIQALRQLRLNKE